jgi:putative transposase
MARMARFKVNDDPSWYHVHSRTSGIRGDYPLQNPLCQRKMVGLIKHFSKVYVCQVAAFCLMGNHYHLVINFNDERELSHDELMKRAQILYPNSINTLNNWKEEEWLHFRKRLFDLSEFMRNLQAAFARWYNKTFERRGRFWADRFKSIYLEDLKAVLDCMLYIELNPVRANLVQRPETWKSNSIYLRTRNIDQWLIPLASILDQTNKTEALKEYRMRLYYRGNIPTRENQAKIPDAIIASEQERGFGNTGIYRSQLRYFTDGIALGSEEFIRQQLEKMRETEQYLRRKNPVQHLNGLHLTIREQRSHAICF